MNATAYWSTVDSIDGNTPIDPSFGQSQQNEDSQYGNDTVAAAAVANVERAAQVRLQPNSSEVDSSQQSSADSSRSHHGSQPSSSSSPSSSSNPVSGNSSSVQQSQPSVSGPGNAVGQQQQQQLTHQDANQLQMAEYNKQGRPLSTSKRAMQNRQAQRAFRLRKEMYVKELESKVQELKASKDTIDMLRQENIQLRDYILSLQSRLIEHPAGVPTPPSVYARQQGDIYDPKIEK